MMKDKIRSMNHGNSLQSVIVRRGRMCIKQGFLEKVRIVVQLSV